MRMIALPHSQLPPHLRDDLAKGWITPGRTYDGLGAIHAGGGVQYLVETDSGSPMFFESARFLVAFPWWPASWTMQIGDLKQYANRAHGLDLLIGYPRLVGYEDHFELLVGDSATEHQFYRQALIDAVGDTAQANIALDLAQRLDNELDGEVEALTRAGEYASARKTLTMIDPELSRPGRHTLFQALSMLTSSA